MKFGIFMEEMRTGLAHGEAFHEAFSQVDAAEAWGVHGIWLGEIHFNPIRSVISSPLVMASAIAARTRRLRVGTAVHILPLSNPLRIAEEVATLDQISEGRFDFGIGRSGGVRAYQIYGVPYEESQARFREALEVIVLAFKGEPVTYEGRFHRIRGAVVSPSPYQRPHPPIRMAATSADTFALVGRLGLDLFVGLRGMDIPELRGHVQTYRHAWRDAGHPGEPSVHLRIPVYAAPTEKEALEEPRASIEYYFDRQAEMTRAPGGLVGTGSLDQRLARAEQLSTLTYDAILAKRVAFGSPSALVERFTRLRDELTLDGIVAEMNSGGLIPPELERRSLRIVTHEVLPKVA
jgi:alkanesulfonate monooxygenase SsuD/methylene tetrahydromethanopterin reductase-like flavin-dependent oxidoreductase (luciferase family)